MLKPLDPIHVKGVFRGQHGRKGASIIQTRLPSITFSNLEAAVEYATDPNDSRDITLEPRVIKADLRIERPLPLNGLDCFIEAPIIFAVMGRDAGTAFLIAKEYHVYNTGNWQERFAGKFSDVASMARQSPELLDELYLDAYAALDNPEFVAAATALGFDGAVHYGNGVTACELEYRVFSDTQISNLEVLDYDARALAA
jgi:hypothetical protein